MSVRNSEETREAAVQRRIREAGERARAEAGLRRKIVDEAGGAKSRPKEVSGRAGPDPVRYGDWEVNGVASDF
jgi:hypothetical protein